MLANVPRWPDWLQAWHMLHPRQDPSVSMWLSLGLDAKTLNTSSKLCKAASTHDPST